MTIFVYTLPDFGVKTSATRPTQPTTYTLAGLLQAAGPGFWA